MNPGGVFFLYFLLIWFSAGLEPGVPCFYRLWKPRAMTGRALQVVGRQPRAFTSFLDCLHVPAKPCRNIILRYQNCFISHLPLDPAIRANRESEIQRSYTEKGGGTGYHE